MNDDPMLAARHLAARLAARAQIEDVRLVSTSATLERQPIPPLTYHLDTSARIDYEEGDDSFVVACSYDVVITDSHMAEAVRAEGNPTTVDTRDETVLKSSIVDMHFEYAALFTLSMREGDEPISKDELQAYATSTGQFALYPYARQYVYDLTGRLGLPPLTVGVLRLPYQPEREGPLPLPGTAATPS